MDTTFKTNKYQLPLLEIIGLTCTCLSLSTGFVFLSNEKEKNFIWPLQKLRGSLLTSHVGPEIIVYDRDLALTNAINIVFPKATNLLCQFHINKNVKAKCKMLVVLLRIHGGLSLTVQRSLNLMGLLKILELFVHCGPYLLNI